MPVAHDLNKPLARVAVVEDDEELRERILVDGMRGYGFAATGFGDSNSLYRDMLGGDFDLVVLDINLPGEDGFSVARHLREARAMQPGIVMLTGRGDSVDQVRALGDGADIYLHKPVELDVLAATLRSLLRRMRAPQAEADSGWRLESDGWCLRLPQGTTIALTLPERRVLDMLCAARGEPVAREALIAALTDDVHAFDPHRLDMLVHRLRRKIEAHTSAPSPLRAVRAVGYAFVD